VATDSAVVRDHDEIVDLGASAEPSRAKRAAIDGGAGTDFNVIADFDSPQLRRLDVTAILESVTKTIRSEHRIGVNGHSVPENGPIVEDDVGVECDVIAQPTIAPDDGPGTDVTTRSNHTAGADRRERMNARIGANNGRRMHAGKKIDAMDRERRSAVKELCDGGECRARIGDTNQRLPDCERLAGNNDGGGKTTL
jgi:hypothetical protein